VSAPLNARDVLHPSMLGYVVERRLRAVRLAAAHGDTPASIQDFLGTEGGDRSGRCFELSALALLQAPEGSLLVHGSIHGPDEDHERIAHAWVRIRRHGLVWEPLHAAVWVEDEFVRWSRAREEREYSLTTMLQLSKAHDHTGPWHEPRYPTAEDRP
jgi:hypothetical protein